MGRPLDIEQGQMVKKDIKEDETMNKASKLFGAMALSAALTAGCALPAFADDPYKPGEGQGGTSWDSTTWDPNDRETFPSIGTDGTDQEMADAVTDNKGTTSSNVWVDTFIDNLSVTVPLNVKVMAKASGGELKAVPSTGIVSWKPGTTASGKGYRIENWSGLDVKVVGISSDDTIAENQFQGGAVWKLVPSTTAVDGAGYTATGKKADLALTLSPSAAANATGTNIFQLGGAVSELLDYNGGNRYGDKGETGTPAVVDLDGTATSAAPNWVIEARLADGSAADHSDGAPGILGLSLAGKSSVVSNDAMNLTDDAGNVVVDKAFQITYTIAAA